jgi:hypothetical protein
MSDTDFDPKNIIDSYRKAFAPVLKAQEEGVKAIDRVGRYQYALAGDYLEWSLAQAKLALNAPTPTDFFTKQVELTTTLSEKLRVRAQEFAALAAEARAGVADAAEQSARNAGAAAAMAADAVQKAAEPRKFDEFKKKGG